MPGVHSELPEVGAGTDSDSRVPGRAGGYQSDAIGLTSQQNQEDSSRGLKTPGRARDISPRSGAPTGQDERSSPGDPTSSPILQEPADGFITGSGEGQSGLRDSTVPLTQCEGGAQMVGHPVEELEWQSYPESGHRHDHRLRCLPQGLGHGICITTDWGPMVSGGEEDAHKLSGITSCNPGSADFPEEQDRNTSIAEDRQHHSSSIHKSPGRHSIERTSDPDKRLMDVVPGKEHPHHSSAHPRDPEHHSRCRVSQNGGQIRLDAGQSHLQEDRQMLRSDRGGPIRISPDASMPSLFQLAARSLCSGDRRLLSGLDTVEGLCQPSMVPNRANTPIYAHSTSQACFTGPSLEDPVLVPNASADVDRLSTGDPAQQPDQGGRGTNDPNPQTGRVAYLRGMFRGKQFLEEATALLLKSWRSKTSKSYDSLFRRWASWCHELSADPFSAPVTDVANFLVDLHSKGYKYNSINAYRSAISSVHEKVEGSDVGQHPTISRLMKGIFNDRPPLPRYTSTWDVQTVLGAWESMHPFC